MKRVSTTLLFSNLLFGILLSALLNTSAMAAHMLAEDNKTNKLCLREASGSNEETANSGVRIRGANASERELINRTIAKMNSLSKNGQFEPLRKLDIFVLDYLNRGNCTPASQTNGYVELARRCPPGTGLQFNFMRDMGAGFVVHEIAHHVGNHGRGYLGYPGGCHITGYCTHTRSGIAHHSTNEEFAEVFAAYVLNPGLLRKTTGCGPAFRHMHKLFGGRAPGMSCPASATRGAANSAPKSASAPTSASVAPAAQAATAVNSSPTNNQRRSRPVIN